MVKLTKASVEKMAAEMPSTNEFNPQAMPQNAAGSAYTFDQFYEMYSNDHWTGGYITTFKKFFGEVVDIQYVDDMYYLDGYNAEGDPLPDIDESGELGGDIDDSGEIIEGGETDGKVLIKEEKLFHSTARFYREGKEITYELEINGLDAKQKVLYQGSFSEAYKATMTGDKEFLTYIDEFITAALVEADPDMIYRMYGFMDGRRAANTMKELMEENK